MTSTFWGLRLEPGKRYSTTVDKSFHVSMAALDCNTVKNEKDIHCVMLEEGESSIPFILCNLHKPKILQSRLNLNFESGDRITFFCRGSGVVHLTGYIIPEDDDLAQFGEDGEEMEEEEDAEEEEEDEDEEEKDVAKLSKVNGLPVKRKGASAAGLPSKKKKKGIEPDSDEDDADDDSDGFMEDGEEEDDSGDSSGDEEAESDEESESVLQVQQKKPSPPSNLEQQGKKKKKNKQKQGGEGQQSPSPGSPQAGKLGQQNKGAQPTAAQQKKKQQQQPAATEKPAAGKKTLEGGVAVQDLKIGNGPVCKPGKMAVVYYTGRLKSNSKVFDQTSHGPGFKFRVGRGEVIKGWDVGVAGMKVGGKRLITCPPNMAYGQKGNPPTIPANSTLVFEVELKGVH